VERRTLPEEMPEGPFDLILASEVLYYFTREEMIAMLYGFETMLAPGGALLAVHWRRETQTYPLQGDEVHELLASHTSLALTESVSEPDYRLDLFENRR
jgi:cyclopropane fatty-acyl-phospholipid synthase-like methyltransferase